MHICQHEKFAGKELPKLPLDIGKMATGQENGGWDGESGWVKVAAGEDAREVFPIRRWNNRDITESTKPPPHLGFAESQQRLPLRSEGCFQF